MDTFFFEWAKIFLKKIDKITKFVINLPIIIVKVKKFQKMI